MVFQVKREEAGYLVMLRRLVFHLGKVNLDLASHQLKLIPNKVLNTFKKTCTSHYKSIRRKYRRIYKNTFFGHNRNAVMAEAGYI